MCVGIPGRVVEIADETGMIARVDVAGVPRNINVALVAEDGLAVGDWVLVHLGFAMEVIEEREAQEALATLRLHAGLDEAPDGA